MKKNFKHLVLGAKYKDREGREYGPMIESGSEKYPFKCAKTGRGWTDKGRFDVSCKSRLDLVELVSIPETQTQKRKVTDLGSNEAIHCATEAEAEAICNLMHEAGMKWIDGLSYKNTTCWEDWEENSCYYPSRGQCLVKAFAVESEHTIYPASDFLPESEPTPAPANAPFWMVRLEGSGEPKFRHTTQESAIQEAHRLLATLTGYTKATITMHYPVTKVATVTVKRLTETEYVNEADYRPEDDHPF